MDAVLVGHDTWAIGEDQMLAGRVSMRDGAGAGAEVHR